MKFKTTALYFLVLVVIGAVYAGMNFEKDKAARREKEAKRVFTFAAKDVSRIEIESGPNKAVSLKKTSKWTITSPIVSEVDNVQLTGLLSTLQNIERERKIGPSGNLKDFGLDKPSIVVRILAGSKWLELDAGAQNPVGTDRYASAGKGGEVFLISSQAYDDLNKNLTDLRRKELFSWNPDEVKAFRISWKNGGEVDLARQGETNIWKSKGRPDIKISGEKVDNLLEGLHWLRAADFLENGSMPPSPDIAVKFELSNGKTPELRVALPGAGIKQAVATSTELPCPVLLSTYFLSSIPHSTDSLVDRSLLSANPSDVKKITWRIASSSGDLVRLGEDKWGKADGAAAPKPLKNSWSVESFLAFAHNAEYIAPAPPAGKPVQGARNSVQFTDVFGKKTSLTWNAPGTTGPVEGRLEKDGGALAVELKPEVIRRMGDSLARMIPVESGAPPKSGADGKK